MDHQRADHQRHQGVGRNAHGQQRDEGSLRPGIVRCFGRGHPFNRALAEAGRVFGNLLFDGVGGKGRQSGTTTGQNAHDRTDAGAAHRRREGGFEVFPTGEEVFQLLADDHARFRPFQILDDFGQAKKAHRDGNETQAVGAFRDIEGHPRGPGIDINTHDAQQQAQNDHGERLHHRALRQNNGSDEAQNHQAEEFDGGKVHGKP